MLAVVHHVHGLYVTLPITTGLAPLCGELRHM